MAVCGDGVQSRQTLRGNGCAQHGMPCHDGGLMYDHLLPQNRYRGAPCCLQAPGSPLGVLPGGCASVGVGFWCGEHVRPLTARRGASFRTSTHSPGCYAYASIHRHRHARCVAVGIQGCLCALRQERNQPWMRCVLRCDTPFMVRNKETATMHCIQLDAYVVR